MSRKMTVVFHDEDLYKSQKVEAAKRHISASKIMTDAAHEWLESQEDAELLPVIEAVETELKDKGDRPWSEVEQELERLTGLHRDTTKTKF
jgi:hypothetical protein